MRTESHLPLSQKQILNVQCGRDPMQNPSEMENTLQYGIDKERRLFSKEDRRSGLVWNRRGQRKYADQRVSNTSAPDGG